MAGPLRGRRRRVVVVGAGLGDLSAACHLVGRGHDVVVIEREDQPGGRAAQVVRDGFTFDVGPTVLTMPGLLADAVRAAGSELSDLLTLRPLDPAYRACFADGSTIRVRRGREAMAEEVRAECGPRDADAFVRFAAWLEELYLLEMPAFIDRNYDRPWDLLRPPGPALCLLRLGAWPSMHGTLASTFRDERLHRLFGFQAMYAGMSPHRARAAFAVITYMDSIAGVYTAEGGMGAVPHALAAAAEKGGATLRYGVEVQRVIRAAGAGSGVAGVLLADGEVVTADAVVVNADLPVACRELLPDLAVPRSLRRATYSPSAFLWHVGVRGMPEQAVAHHNIHFGADWKGAFDAVLRDGRRMPDPSVLVTVPTVSDAGLAPAGHSTLYVLEPVPSLRGRVDWATDRAATGDRLATLLRHWGYLSGRTDEIVVERADDPTDWAARGMAAGTPFALAHSFFQSGPFRPPNLDRRVPGLVFVGSGTVPGVGVPMVLVSGRLAADRVDELA
ncbi:MAG: phytoene desaturase family protein [Jiangellaceae bacterium]